MAQILPERRRKAEPPCEEMPPKPSKSVVHEAQQKQQTQLEKAELGELRPGLFPAGRGGQADQPKDHERKEAAHDKHVAPRVLARPAGGLGGDRVCAAHYHCGPVIHRSGQHYEA